MVINTARAGLFDDAAMLEAVHAGRVWVGLDCFADEPLGSDSPWLSAPQTVLTPHVAGTTTAAFRAMGMGAARAILAHLQAPPLVPPP